MVLTIVDMVGEGFSEGGENYKKLAEVRRTFLKTVCISAPIWTALSLASAFTPDTKTLAAAYVVPAIVNSKGVAKVEGASIKLLDLLEKRLTDELSAKAGGYDAKAH
jgi:hypothetical protein